MRTPLDVVLSVSGGTAAEAHIGRRCGDLQFSAQSPGGYVGGSVTLDEPILSDLLLDYDTVAVYDRRSGVQVNGGRLDEPEKGVSEQGEVWQVTFTGEGPAHMQDVTVPRIYIETSLENFYTKGRGGAGGGAQVGPTPSGSSDDAIVLALAGGTVVANGIAIQMSHDALFDCGMDIGGYGFTRQAGQAAAGYQNESAVNDSAGGAFTTVSSANWATAAVAAGPFVVVTDFPSGSRALRFNVRRSGGALTVVDDTSWGAFYNVYVAARRKLADGSNASNSAHANSYVLASEIVADLLGRDLPRFDGANATVTATTHHIDQLAYLDGATPYQIVQDLLQLESGFTWHVWDVNQSTGLYDFEWVAWPTTVRYDASVIDGFQSPAPSDDLFNEVNVRYRDAKGRTKIATRTQTVDTLGSLTRAAFLDLSDEVGSLANANRAGDRFLADHAVPPNAGTLTIARPIMDATLGRMVWPWELRPGNLIRVRGVRPYVDALNATDRDGVTVFRIVSTSFSDSQGAATLELDAYTPDEARQIARLTTQRRRRR